MENRNLSSATVGVLVIKDALRTSFVTSGIEKTEDLIKDLYKGKARDKLLYFYHELIRR